MFGGLKLKENLQKPSVLVLGNNPPFLPLKPSNHKEIEKYMTWKKKHAEEYETAKFVKTGTKVTVNPTVEPDEREVDGRYGKRRMYIIETDEYGKIYVSPNQFLRIAEALNISDYKNKTTLVI